MSKDSKTKTETIAHLKLILSCSGPKIDSLLQCYLLCANDTSELQPPPCDKVLSESQVVELQNMLEKKDLTHAMTYLVQLSATEENERRMVKDLLTCWKKRSIATTHAHKSHSADAQVKTKVSKEVDQTNAQSVMNVVYSICTKYLWSTLDT